MLARQVLRIIRIHVRGKKRVIDGGAFVEDDERIGWSGTIHLGQFIVNEEVGIPTDTDVAVHGNTSTNRSALIVKQGTRPTVAGTFVNSHILPQIRIQLTGRELLIEINKIKIARVADVAVAPDAGVEHILLVVSGIHDPGERDLLGIGHALQALRLDFGFGQGRQEQPRENRDDRDDHQQLNEGETAPPHAREQIRLETQTGTGHWPDGD